MFELATNIDSQVDSVRLSLKGLEDQMQVLQFRTLANNKTYGRLAILLPS